MSARPAAANRSKKAMRERAKTDAWSQNRVGYLFLAPWLVGFFTFNVVPMIASFYLSLTNYDFFTSPRWIGFENYVEMFLYDARYLKSITVTLRYMLISVPLQLLFALTLALMLNKGIRGLALFRAVYYVPSLLGGSVAVAILWMQVFGANGLVNQLLGLAGVEGVSWLANPNYSLYTVILLRVWQFGSPMVIFLAALRQIPSELYEAASVDGAGKLYTFFRITLPLLSPVILFNVVMQTISAFQEFTAVFVLGGGTGGPLDSLLFYSLYLYTVGFRYFEMGYAAAQAWVLLLMIAILTAVIFRWSRRWVYYES